MSRPEGGVQPFIICYVTRYPLSMVVLSFILSSLKPILPILPFYTATATSWPIWYCISRIHRLTLIAAP
jgi:hypothetical protein